MFKPIEINIQQELNCTAAKAFALAMDLERRPEWIDFIEKSYYTIKTPQILGSKYKEKFEFLGFHLYLEYEIREYIQDRLVIAKCNMPPFKPLLTLYAQPIHDKKTKCGIALQITPGPLALLPRKMVIREIENIINPLVEKFKSMAES